MRYGTLSAIRLLFLPLALRHNHFLLISQMFWLAVNTRIRWGQGVDRFETHRSAVNSINLIASPSRKQRTLWTSRPRMICCKWGELAVNGFPDLNVVSFINDYRQRESFSQSIHWYSYCAFSFKKHFSLPCVRLQEFRLGITLRIKDIIDNYLSKRLWSLLRLLWLRFIFINRP